MYDIDRLIIYCREERASDIHITAGMPLMMRVHGRLEQTLMQPDEEETTQMLLGMMDEKQRALYDSGEDVDFAMKTSDGNRQRVNIFRQQRKIAATIRILNNKIPTLEEINMPPLLYNLAEEPRGLILVTGPTGSGKSTTLSAMIEHVNRNRSEHIITIEDPIEYTYESKMSLIHQREVGRDVTSFAAALRSALREDPDVILVGEMRDYETISAALTAAETGHLVLSTLHTTGAAQTMERIIDACPTGSQNQVRTQLSGVLKGVITQCLMPVVGGQGRVAGTEILLGTDAVCNLIREGKTHQIGSSMQSGANVGMHTLNMDLMRLVREGRIDRATAYQFTNDKRDLEQFI